MGYYRVMTIRNIRALCKYERYRLINVILPPLGGNLRTGIYQLESIRICFEIDLHVLPCDYHDYLTRNKHKCFFLKNRAYFFRHMLAIIVFLNIFIFIYKKSLLIGYQKKNDCTD